MEVKKYNPVVVNSLAKTKPKPKEASPLFPQLKPQPIPKAKTKPKPKTKLEAKGLSLENKKKLDIIYAKSFVKTCRK